MFVKLRLVGHRVYYLATRCLRGPRPPPPRLAPAAPRATPRCRRRASRGRAAPRSRGRRGPGRARASPRRTRPGRGPARSRGASSIPSAPRSCPSSSQHLSPYLSGMIYLFFHPNLVALFLSGSDVSSTAYLQLCLIPLLLTTLTTWNKPKPVVQVDYRPSAPGRGRPRPWRREEGGGQGEPRHQARQQDQQRPGQAEEVRVFR